MIEVAVMYADLHIERVPWGAKDTLRRDGVICIAVLNDKRQYFSKRQQALIEHDFYILTWTDTECCLTWHDGDYGFFSFDKPEQADWRFPFILTPNSIVFEGETIESEEYAKAKSIFADLQGGMF